MMKGTGMTGMTVMMTRMTMTSQRLSLVPSAMSFGACFSSVSFYNSDFHDFLPRITYALFRKTTTAKSAPMKIKTRPRKMGRGQDGEDGGSGSGTSEPADSIMDSSSEEEADDEVDGMLGE